MLLKLMTTATFGTPKGSCGPKAMDAIVSNIMEGAEDVVSALQPRDRRVILGTSSPSAGRRFRGAEAIPEEFWLCLPPDTALR